MERTEFQEKLARLLQLAGEREGGLSVGEVQDFFQELLLTAEQMKLVYEYLAANHITVRGYVPEQEEKEELPYTREELTFLKTYQKDLDAFVLLEEAELEALLAQAEQGDDLARARAAEQFLCQVLERAKAFHGRGLPLEDLVQEGNIGLMLSLETLGLRDGGTSAAAYVRSEIERSLREALEENESVRRAGSQIADKVNRLSDSIQQLTEELERQVTVEELSAFLDMSVDEIEDILKLAGDDIEVAEEKDVKGAAAFLFPPREDRG